MAEPFSCDASCSDLTHLLDAPLLDELAMLCCFALSEERLDGDWAVTLAFTTDDHMARLHETFMNVAGTTDIITFPFDDEPGGDIAISVAQADRQRIDDGWELDDELRFLVVHGALHLAGWDDRTQDDRSAMLQRQRQIIAAFQDASLRSL